MADETTISGDDLCKLSGLTDRRHRQLADQGLFPAPVLGRYELAPTIRGLLSHYRAQAEKKTDALAAEQLRQARADADLAEMRRDERAKKLFPADQVVAAWTDALTELREVIATFNVPREERARLMAALRDIPVSEYGTQQKPAADPSSDDPGGAEILGADPSG